MRISKHIGVFVLGLGFGAIAGMWVWGSVPARAQDLSKSTTRSFGSVNAVEGGGADTALPKSKLGEKLAEDLFSAGANAYFDGDLGSAVKRFEQAAEDGHPLAQWKLGQMYQEGEGVGASPTIAFKYFKDVAIGRADEPPNSPVAPFVAYSLVAVGKYYLNGIEGTDIRVNPGKAMKIFRYAASFYGNAEAQFSLGRMYFDGVGGVLDKYLAARWLKLAALKGHHKSQALLGRMMFLGDGIPQRPSEGLMWLTLARERAKGREDDWIRDDQERAFALATETERRTAVAGAGQWNHAFAEER